MNTHGKDSTGYPLRTGDHVRFRGTVHVVEGFPGGKSTRGFPLIQLEGVAPGSQDDIDELEQRMELSKTEQEHFDTLMEKK